MTWFATDNLARSQFRMFSQLGDEMHMSDDEQRRVLRLSEQEWANWSDFLDDGPLPAVPQLPVMLRRLGSASYRLAAKSERGGITV
jgi:phosphoglycolate phosphatase-like HAD superfamily hydrolase